MTGSDELHASLAELGARLDDIEDVIAAHCADGNWLAGAELYAEFAGLRRAMGERDGSLAELVAEAMPSEREVVPGAGVFQRRRGRERKAWDWPALLPKVTRAYLDPEGTGEFPSDPMVAVDRMRAMADDVIGLTGSKSPRVTALRGLGIDPDEFCESKPGRLSVQITPVDA